MSCASSEVYDAWSSSLTATATPTAAPTGCNPSTDSSCSKTSPTNALLSSPMLTTYAIFGAIVIALILFMSLNAATIHKAKIKASMKQDAHTNLGLSYK